MSLRFLIFLLFFSPNVLLSKQEHDNTQASQIEHDLELFEFLAMYDKDDAVFIDAEIDEKTLNEDAINQQVKTSEPNE